jgi:O-antigen/teichoic acid export membrane protein
VIAVMTILAAALNVVLNLVLVPRLGLTGSALATLAAYAFLHVALSMAGRGRQKAPPPARVLQLQLAGVAVFAVLSAGIADTPVVLAVRVVAATGCVVWFLRELMRIGRKSADTVPAAPAPPQGADVSVRP